jgi:hypothetical protein
LIPQGRAVNLLQVTSMRAYSLRTISR